MVLAMPIFVLSLNSFFQLSKGLIHKEILKHSSSVLNTTVQNVVRYMKSVETAAKSNVWLIEENFNPDSLQVISRRIVRLNNSVLSCSVSAEPNAFPEYGRYFSVYSVNEGDTILTVLEPDFEYFEKSWYKTAIHTGKPSWVDPFSDFYAGTINYNDAIASYCIPLRPNGRHIAGVVSADFSFSRLAETILANNHPYPSSYYMLLGRDGRYLVHPNTSLLFKKTIFTENDSIENDDIFFLGHEMTAGNRGITHVMLDNKEFHVCYAPIPGTHWSLALVTPEDEVLMEYRHMGYLMAVLVILGLLLIWWLTMRVVKNNIQPVRQLLEITTKMAEGNYNEIIPRSSGKDVIAQLQNSFADMQESIVAHMEEVKRTAEQVELENKELEETTQRAQQADQEKRHFVRHVLRQIRMPLNIIEGMADVLRTRTLSHDEAEVVIDTMKLNVARLRRRLLMLYDSSEARMTEHSEHQRNADVPCNELAQESIAFMLSTHKGMNVHFESDLPDSQCIRTNHFYLMSSLTELLHNSAKYSDGKHIAMRVTQTEKTVRFIVEDKGKGLPAEWQDLILQPFKQLDEESPGFGLGLPLVKRHVTSLDGNLFYDSDYKEGCRIIVEMPKD